MKTLCFTGHRPNNSEDIDIQTYNINTKELNILWNIKKLLLIGQEKEF